MTLVLTRSRLVLALAVVAVALVAGLAARSLATGPSATAALGPPRYVEEATAAGLDHQYAGDWPFVVGGGVAAFDCDDDRQPDLFLAGGQRSAALFRNDSLIGGALRFTRVVGAATDLTGVTGAYPIDIDDDGRNDLVVLRAGGNALLRGLGDCRFETANERWRIDGGDAVTAAFSAAWERSSQRPTLAFGNYVELDTRGELTGECSPNHLVRPEPGGRTYAAPIHLAPGWCALSLLFSDWSRTGRTDLRVSSDRHYYRDGEEQLWRIAPGEPPRLYTPDDGWARMQIWGMGIASHDLTGDGRPEVFLTSQGDNKLQTLAGDPTRPAYRDIALRRGVTAQRPFTGGDVLPSTAWHAEFQDVNNDGYVDLFVAKGNVDDMPDYAMRDPSNLLLGQVDGTFVEAAEAAGMLSFERGRGAAVVDFNLDGLLDAVEVNRRADVRLWRSAGAGDAAQPAPLGNWIAVRLRQFAPNRDAVGSWIEVRAAGRIVERELTIGGGHAGGQLGWIHFGLGRADRADVRVHWPNGEIGPWLPVPVNGFAIVERGAAEVVPWQPVP